MKIISEKEISILNKKMEILESVATKTREEYRELFKKRAALVQEEGKKNIGRCFKCAEYGNSRHFYIVLNVPRWENRARCFREAFSESTYECLHIMIPMLDKKENEIPVISLEKVSLYKFNRDEKYFGSAGQFEKISREEFNSALEKSLKNIEEFIKKTIDKNK